VPETWKKALLWAGLVGVCVAGRLMPHPPNFTPMAATALFAGFLFQRRAAALAAVLAALVITDWFTGFYQAGVMATVYAALLLPVTWRGVLRAKPTAVRIGLCAASASVVFFVTTNLAVWWFSGMYAATPSGLAACYAAALPFFKYTLAGDLAWSVGLFGTYFLCTRSGLAGRFAGVATASA
jgi:Family of unknown function (DUF6580)